MHVCLSVDNVGVLWLNAENSYFVLDVGMDHTTLVVKAYVHKIIFDSRYATVDHLSSCSLLISCYCILCYRFLSECAVLI